MGKDDDYDVTPQGDRWEVWKEGARRASSVHGTKAEAVEAARDLAKRHEGSLRIHGSDGTIEEERTYRDDPFPPPG